MKMTTEEAFVKVLQRHGIAHALALSDRPLCRFPISSLRPGITFWDVAHESNGGSSVTAIRGHPARWRCSSPRTAQASPISLPPIKTAYWNHTPMLLVTPQAANKTIGQGGFQEVEQMAAFKDMVAYQEEVRDPSRMAEVLNRVIENAIASPPRARSTCRAITGHRSSILNSRRSCSSSARPAATNAVAEAAKILSAAKFPVILSGAGVVLGNAIPDCVALAEKARRTGLQQLPAQ